MKHKLSEKKGNGAKIIPFDRRFGRSLLSEDLIRAVDSQNLEMARSMLKMGIDPDFGSSEMENPLVRAIVKKDINMCRLLIEAGADTNFPSQTGVTPLMIAAGVGDYSLCNLLLENDAAPGKCSNFGESPLMFAAGSGSVDVCWLILDWIGDRRVVLERDSNGMDSVMHAVRKGWLNTALFLLNSCNSPPNYGREIMNIAIDTGKVEFLMLLLPHLKINARDNEGCTPLMRCAGRGDVQMGGYLVFKGADINAISDEGATALMIAVSHCKNDFALMLLERGASSATVGCAGRYRGKSALDLAISIYDSIRNDPEYDPDTYPGVDTEYHSSMLRAQDEFIEALKGYV